MTKAYRQGQILNLIRTRPVHTQDELAAALQEKGIPATQVTLSRDIRDLSLVKTSEGYRQLTPERSGPGLAALAADFLLDIRPAQNILVLKTSPGHANTIAVAIDHENWSEIVGTIAGDDTILVVAPDTLTADTLRARLLALLAE
jgi:transcriptional regulator of arginine metabolism